MSWAGGNRNTGPDRKATGAYSVVVATWDETGGQQVCILLLLCSSSSTLLSCFFSLLFFSDHLLTTKGWTDTEWSGT